MLECVAEANPKPEFEIEIGDETLVSSDFDVVLIEKAAHRYKFETRFEKVDGRSYPTTCTARTSGLEAKTEKTVLYFKKSDKKPEFFVQNTRSDFFDNATIVEGDNINVTCLVSDTPEVLPDAIDVSCGKVSGHGTIYLRNVLHADSPISCVCRVFHPEGCSKSTHGEIFVESSSNTTSSTGGTLNEAGSPTFYGFTVVLIAVSVAILLVSACCLFVVLFCTRTRSMRLQDDKYNTLVHKDNEVSTVHDNNTELYNEPTEIPMDALTPEVPPRTAAHTNSYVEVLPEPHKNNMSFINKMLPPLPARNPPQSVHYSVASCLDGSPSSTGESPAESTDPRKDLIAKSPAPPRKRKSLLKLQTSSDMTVPPSEQLGDKDEEYAAIEKVDNTGKGNAGKSNKDLYFELEDQ